jgi:hypothetical protein
MNQVTRDDQHRYAKGEDKGIASVTTILGVASGDNARFEEWRKANEGKSLAAQERGTAVHLLIETFFSDPQGALELAELQTDEVKGYFLAFVPILSRCKALHLELPLVARTEQGLFGGTVDAVLQIGDSVIVADWKTTKRKPAAAQQKKWGVQLGAYAYAIEQEYPNLSLQGGAIINVTPERCGYKMREFFWTRHQLTYSFDKFLYLQSRYKESAQETA